MKKIIALLLLASLLHWPVMAPADECMDGDCENGTGTGFTEEGLIYKGEWKNGMPHGSGKLTISKDKAIEGRWENGKLVDDQKEK
ncbi:MAG: hypothetical protein KKG47_03340 [Proteobacteria bacterium]|nr:hypothetical protein [Pseudomonadota bacterium]MBU1739044.1 hypothetical protein [Pseudomonadota bacterium]